MLTLVGTPPNLVVDGTLQREGFKGLSFLSFTPIGVVILVLAIGYILLARHWLIRNDSEGTKNKSRPRRNMLDLIQRYELAGREHRVRILPSSPFVAKTIGECPAFREHGTKVVAIERPGRFSTQLINPQASTQLAAGDILLIDTAQPDPENLRHPAEEFQLEPLPLQGTYFTDQSREVGMAEMIIPPDSTLIGKSLYRLDFRGRYGLTVAGLRQGQHAVKDKIAERHLRAGDTVLVIGPWKAIHQIQTESHDFVVLSLPKEADQMVPAASQAPYALGALLLMIVMMVAGIVPNVIAALISCMFMGLFGCVTMDSAYKSINWKVLILIVGMIPIATALQKTGGIDLAVKGLTSSGHSDPRILLVALFALTAGIGLFISNTVTAVLMAPIAISAASALDVSPYPFAVTVALGASTAFMTPISSPVNTLVLGPGQYKFMDFVKIGVPLSILVMIICLIMIPMLFPFR
jgi:di/tricarboxylate transporter